MAAPDTTRIAIYTAIGELCMVWANLDRSLNTAIQAALNCTDEQAKCIGSGIEPVAGRIKLLRNLLHATGKDQAWLALSSAVLNQTEKLCAERNRIVHDGWDFKAAKPAQLDRRAKIQKAQSRGESILVTEIRKDITADLVLDLNLRVATAATGLLLIYTDLNLEREQGPLPTESSLLNFLGAAETHLRQSIPPASPK